MDSKKKYFFNDFTGKGYEKILKQAKSRFYFAEYGEKIDKKNIALWRHDIDISINRAFKIAQIEKKNGVKSTFFLHCHSFYYNFFEKEQSDLVKKIEKMGHKIGLHFDPDFYDLGFEDIDKIEELAKTEKDFLEKTLNIKINVISWHNPGKGKLLNCKKNIIAGMINAYGSDIFDNFNYCSDSDGYWRFKRLSDFLDGENNKKIQVLTHPGWWVDKPMSPYQRILRSVDGRKKKTINNFLKQMKEMKRKIIK